MQTQGGYLYPGGMVLKVFSLAVFSITAIAHRLMGLTLWQTLSLFLSMEGTVLWACSLTPKGLTPPPEGARSKISWFFSEQHGTTLSLNQPIFFLGILFSLSGSIVGTISSSVSSIHNLATREVKRNATMKEVEAAIGKPDRVEVKPGGVDKGYETPTIIVWHYVRFPMTGSDAQYGSPGQINFIPERFSEQSIGEADKIARQYGVEASDSYRAVSLEGSFPISKEWAAVMGDSGWITVKPIEPVQAK